VLPHSTETSSNGASNGHGGDGAVEVEISIRGLTKSFGSQTILDDITCDIPKGKITLMLGPSGTGKSVFLKNIMGLLKPERGEIWIDGKDIVKLGSRDLYKVRRKFGVLFQDGALFGSMNIFDNVAFPLREHTRKPEREIKQIVDEKLSMVGLQGAEKKLPGEISGGMKKRAGLARALVLDPEIVMFDEPDSGLDPVRTAFLNELILDLNRQLKATFIVVTHDIATARRVADYIGMLYLRNLVRFDTKENMFNSDIPVVRQFLAGATEGPIGMSEEADAGRNGNEAVSTSGMTAEETEALEREAGAPVDAAEGRAQVTTAASPGEPRRGATEIKEEEETQRRDEDTPEPEEGLTPDDHPDKPEDEKSEEDRPETGTTEAEEAEAGAEAKADDEAKPDGGDAPEPGSDGEVHAAGETRTPEELAVGAEHEPDESSAEAREESPEAPSETGNDDEPQTEPERPAGGEGTDQQPDEASADDANEAPGASNHREEEKD